MSQLITNSFTRRSFLQAGSACLALPFLESLALSNTSRAAPPKRMIFLGTGFGFTEDTFYPKEAGKFSDIGMTEGMAPLKLYQNDITMISNMTNWGASNPHGGSQSYLTGAKVTGTPGVRIFNSISCDQVAANYLGEDTRYRSLVISSLATTSNNDGHAAPSLSRDHAGRPITGTRRASDLYRVLFSKSAESRDAMVARMQRRQSLLDLAGVNGLDLKHMVGKDDHEKLEEYFQGLRQIEQGIEQELKWIDVPKPRPPFSEPSEEVIGEAEIKIVYDMLIAALQTDMTRVATYRLPVNTLLETIGVSLRAHSLSHYGFSKERRSASMQRDLKLTELLAYFIGRLKQSRDIDGSTLFDNCIVSFGSNLRTGHALKNVPAILTGGGARGIKLGEHIVLPKKDSPLANLWLTLMQEAGVPVQSFSHSTGIIPEILKTGAISEQTEQVSQTRSTTVAEDALPTSPTQQAPRNYTVWMGTDGKRFKGHYLGKSGNKTQLELEDGQVIEGAYIRVDF